jgi:hypothetical protein
MLVKDCNLKHIVVPTETDALLLENNLIKICSRDTMYCCVMTKLSVVHKTFNFFARENRTADSPIQSWS